MWFNLRAFVFVQSLQKTARGYYQWAMAAAG
jgi:hypothetical protein